MAPIAQMIATAFGMNDETWARHANPWSVYTRIATVPFIILALWSRAWIGAWSLIPIALLAFWLWYNPRAFPPPASTNNWASKAVLGERVWLNRGTVPIPAHHQRAAQLLSVLGTVGVPVFVYGIVMLQIWPTLLGTAITVLGKLWFIDRMVWLYEDMQDAVPDYRRWRR
jgi:hypothetical protein